MFGTDSGNKNIRYERNVMRGNICYNGLFDVIMTLEEQVPYSLLIFSYSDT